MPAANLNILDEVDRERLRSLVKVHGLSGAARVLTLSRGVVAAALGGVNVRRGSLELLREALKRVALGGDPAESK